MKCWNSYNLNSTVMYFEKSRFTRPLIFKKFLSITGIKLSGLYFLPKKTGLATLILLLILSACTKDDMVVAPKSVAAKTMMNEKYGDDAAQVADIYLPENRDTANTKVLLLIHGGAWASGDKSDFTPYVDALKKQLPGYAIMSINYRLGQPDKNKFPTQEKDIKQAFDYLVSKSGDYLVSNRIVLLGESAGAHLALLQAYKYPAPVAPKAVISLSGPTDLVKLYQDGDFIIRIGLGTLLNGSPTTVPDLYKSSSPVTFISKTSCPTLLFHGSKDDLVPYSQSSLLKDKLNETGIVNQLVTYPDEGHVFTTKTQNEVIAKIKTFLDQYVK